MTRYLVDFTRTLSRIGRPVPTGIDRVELAYLDHLTQYPDSSFVARISGQIAVLSRDAMVDFLDRLEHGDWPAARGFDRWRRRLLPDQRRAQSFVRTVARLRLPSRQIGELAKGVDLRGYDYVNVGHSNLGADWLSALCTAGCARMRVMIHDMIPLDFPQYCRPETPAAFAAKMQAVAGYASDIICNSAHTRDRVEAFFSDWGATPDYRVAHLGVSPPPKDAIHAPDPEEPVFAVLGTIEPRKNHAILLDAWAQLDDPVPHLRIIGGRGWENTETFARLDQARPQIAELGSLSDDTLWTELSRSTALLFPSFAEGYGLPALEAAQMGVPVVCSDIPVFREIMPKGTQFLDPNDATAWRNVIQNWPKQPSAKEKSGADENCAIIPTWDSHFRHVFK